MNLILSEVKLSLINLQVRAIFSSSKPKHNENFKTYLDFYSSVKLVLMNLFRF